MKSEWVMFDEGATVGTPGSENGVILIDEEFAGCARITLERDGMIAPHAITCGIYGWMMDTRFFGGEIEAREEYDKMKLALSKIVRKTPLAGDSELETKIDDVETALSDFVETYR